MPKSKAPVRVSHALIYVGGEVHNVPARDLSPYDLAWLVNQPHIQRRLAADVSSLATALVATGVYHTAAAAVAPEQPSDKE